MHPKHLSKGDDDDDDDDDDDNDDDDDDDDGKSNFWGCMGVVVVVENHYRYINPLKLVAIWEEGFVKQQFTIFMWMKRVVLSHLSIHHCPAHNPPIYLLTWCLHLSFFLSLSPHLTSPPMENK